MTAEAPSSRGHRITRIVGVLVAALGGWPRHGEHPVAVQGVGLSPAVQVEGCVDRAGQGPLILLAPAIPPHDKDAHGRVIHDAVVDPFEPIVEPAPHDVVGEYGGIGGAEAKVDLPDNPPQWTMQPGAHDELLAAPRLLRRRTLAHIDVIGQGAADKDVVPTTQMVGGHGDLVHAPADVHLVPEIVLGRMPNDVLVSLADVLSLQQGDLRQGQRPEGVPCGQAVQSIGEHL